MSGDLNEFKIRDLLAQAAPIDSFGVGTEMVTSRDEPTLSTVYKLVAQETEKGTVSRMKLAKDKRTYPFAKQVFRQVGADGKYASDVIGHADESLPGEPLLAQVMKAGTLISPLPSLAVSRSRCLEQLTKLPRAFNGQVPSRTR